MAGSFSELLVDLAAEQGVLRRLLAGVADDLYDRPSPAEGWTLRDCVVHLAEMDELAAAVAEGIDPREAFRGRPQRQPPEGSVVSPRQFGARELTPAQVFAWYLAGGDRLMAALQRYEGGERLVWAGRKMSVFSFTTARLMEHWSHGLDIHDVAGVRPVDTDRLWHVAQIGYMTRGFSYLNRGLEAPSAPLYVELVAPSGAIWTWGPADAPDRIYGTAGDFCRVVTQRIHVLDTALRTEGKYAKEFLTVAQAFAGPSGRGRPPKGQG